MCHHAVGTDYRTVADAHAGQNRGTDANPYLVFDDNGTAVCCTAVIRIRVVVDGNEVYLWGNEHAVADGDAATVEESAALLYPEYRKIFSVSACSCRYNESGPHYAHQDVHEIRIMIQ